MLFLLRITQRIDNIKVSEKFSRFLKDIKNLPTKLKELALHELVKHEQWESSFKEDNKYFKKASGFVENKDGLGAWKFLLKEQDDGCGEYIDLVEFDKVKS